MILEHTFEDGNKICINMTYVRTVDLDKGAFFVEVCLQGDEVVRLSYANETQAYKVYDLIRKKWLMNGYVQVDWLSKLNAWEA